MVHKSDDGNLHTEAHGTRDLDFDTTEIDNAVMSDIGDRVKRAFDGDDGVGRHSDISVLDVDVLPHVESVQDDTFAPGFVLKDRFELVTLVHSGGMGHVYKAVDYRRQRIGSENIHVAIKMMRRTAAPEHEAHLVLEREAAKAQALSHPNIINIFDFDEHEDRFFLVMEWLDGESVNALLRRNSGQQLAPEIAWSIIEGAAAAIEHAHSHNVVHADINPSNIFITRSGEIKLLDFGVARYCDDSQDTSNVRPTWVTQTYASPEVLSGLQPVFEDDVFSLACIAYRLLSGRHPFDGSISIVAKHEGIEVPCIQGLADRDWLVLCRSLSYARADRCEPISAFIRHTTSTAMPEVASPGYRRMRTLWPLAASVAALAIIAGGWWFWPSETLNKPAVEAQRSPADEPTTSNTEAVPVQAPVNKLLASAVEAVEEGRLVGPEPGNARSLYRKALAIEPTNPGALRGLRSISDTYVQQANQELVSGNPWQASAALAIAAETDPGNPAIMITNELLIAQGDRQLASARLAAVEGDTERAAEMLSIAENFAHLDEVAINEVREQLARLAQEELFLERLAAAEEHIDRGRLTTPAQQNAQTVLAELYRDHGDDPRLLRSMERLGQRLLTRASVATAAAEFSTAGELLDTVDALGVLSPGVAAARESLRTAVDATDFDQAAAAGNDVPELPTVASLDTQANLPATPAASDVALATTLESKGSESGLIDARTRTAREPVRADTAESLSTTTAEPGKPKLSRLDELGIRSYVAPRYPRNASRRRISGLVHVGFDVNTDGSTSAIKVVSSEPSGVFDASAEEAVSQWQFAPQDRVIRANVTVRFELPR